MNDGQVSQAGGGVVPFVRPQRKGPTGEWVERGRAKGDAPDRTRSPDGLSFMNSPGYAASGVKKRAASGGRVSMSEHACPCQGMASALTPPELPTLLPPYAAPSVFRTSR
jgi:hypothetical protein